MGLHAVKDEEISRSSDEWLEIETRTTAKLEEERAHYTGDDSKLDALEKTILRAKRFGESAKVREAKEQAARTEAHRTKLQADRKAIEGQATELREQMHASVARIVGHLEAISAERAKLNTIEHAGDTLTPKLADLDRRIGGPVPHGRQSPPGWNSISTAVHEAVRAFFQRTATPADLRPWLLG